MILLDFEKEIINSQKGVTLEVSDAAINEKYEKGEARIITEQGAVKLSLVNQVFNSENYELQPKYQRRITWDSKKRSKLIESFIMNIPVPPVFIYETDFNRYQVMDGLQRITAIIDFYKDCYELEELTQWPELNGKKYSQLPRKVKEVVETPIQYNAVIISIYGCFEQYIDNVFNEYCLAIYGVIDNYDNLPEKMKEKHIKKLGDFLSNPQRYKNCELTDKQAVKNAVAAFNNPKEGFGNNQKLILSHGSNLKIEQMKWCRLHG